MQEYLYKYFNSSVETTYKEIRLLIPCKKGHSFIVPKEICYCEIEGKYYTKWHLKNGNEIEAKYNLKQSFELLQNHCFFRISSAVIVNLQAVFQITRGEYPQVILSNGTILLLSIRKRKELIETLNKLC